VTITPLLKKGSRETRLLTVSQARANISGGMGKNCMSDISILFLIRYHAGRIKNDIEPIISWFSARQREGQPENNSLILLRYWISGSSANYQGTLR
jgi:hypothetical protein